MYKRQVGGGALAPAARVSWARSDGRNVDAGAMWREAPTSPVLYRADAELGQRCALATEASLLAADDDGGGDNTTMLAAESCRWQLEPEDGPEAARAVVLELGDVRLVENALVRVFAGRSSRGELLAECAGTACSGRKLVAWCGRLHVQYAANMSISLSLIHI